jgi:predicted methyltransferase
VTAGNSAQPEAAEIDLREAINAVSDVVQNRPRPLRDFDQIYMKAGDMVLQSELVARWADGKRLAFIGDGDAISVCVAYLHAREIVPYGPSRITVFDFDERICQAVKRFADHERLEHLDAELYNCLDAFPGPTNFDCFYTNPPWGASNEGESVKVFMQRGMEAVGYDGSGMVVVADDSEIEWPGVVLANLQSAALQAGFAVRRLMPQVHSYHLDDAPDLRSCNVILASSAPVIDKPDPGPITDPERLEHFYGKNTPPSVRYVRERTRLDYGKAHETEYRLQMLDEDDKDNE